MIPAPSLLAWLIVLPLLGGPLVWLLGRRWGTWARSSALAILLADAALAVLLAVRYPPLPAGLLSARGWMAVVAWEWMPSLGVSFKLGLDGVSLLLVLLTLLLGLLAISASWREVGERVGFFHCNLLWVLSGALGVFLALDLFLFYLSWELMLVPMYFLIAIWGHERRSYAALKFLIFTQAGSLVLLVAILGLAFAHRESEGGFTFDYMQLLGTPLTGPRQLWLMLGFFIGFAVKVPIVPLHTWLPDAHTEAPTAGSVILAGLLLKTGAYGLLRFAVPLFPAATQGFAPLGMLLGVVGVLYGAVLAYAQDDLKRLVAYTSVSHLGFVLIGIYARNRLALQGAVLQLLAHGLSTGGLFIFVGALQERIHTREMRRMGGLLQVAPRMAGSATILALAALGLPGLGSFVAEFLVLVGAFSVRPGLTAVATVGLVLATIYALSMVQRVFHGPRAEAGRFADLSARELVTLGVLIAALLWLGLYPQPVLDAAGASAALLLEPPRGASMVMAR